MATGTGLELLPAPAALPSFAVAELLPLPPGVLSSGGDAQVPVANCPNCRMPLECSHCRNLVDAEQLEGVYGEPLHGTDTGEARGSSGREAWTPRARSRFIASLGQRARSQYAASLASAETDDGNPFIRRVADQAWREAGAG